MHGLFGFDPKTMSDDELLDRWNTLTRKIVWAARFSGMDMVAQLQAIKSQIEFEQRERVIEQRMRARAAMPDVIVESDPDMAAEMRQAREEELEKQNKRPSRPSLLSKERIRPTLRPTQDSGDNK